VNRCAPGQWHDVEETTAAQPQPSGDAPGSEPAVTHAVEGETVRLTVRGELTDAARRPLVRTLTDLLLAEQGLQRIELHLHEVRFMNSAGLAVLVQLQKMAVPRAIEVVLVEPPSSVTRPLQLTGLWHRFTVVQSAGQVTAEASGDGGPRPGPADHS
jgi:anti-anti-sigma factor